MYNRDNSLYQKFKYIVISEKKTPRNIEWSSDSFMTLPLLLYLICMCIYHICTCIYSHCIKILYYLLLLFSSTLASTMFLKIIHYAAVRVDAASFIRTKCFSLKVIRVSSISLFHTLEYWMLNWSILKKIRRKAKRTFSFS